MRGTSQRPRLNVHRSLKNMQVQLIDDASARTLLTLSTTAKEVREKVGYGGNSKAAASLGEMFAGLAREKKIEKVLFDRGGYTYHGRIKALAEGLRKGGLVF